MTKWKLEALDTFSDERYPLDGEFDSQQDVEAAADGHLKELEETQPTASSGGRAEDGIQDRIFIVHPDGTKYRYAPLKVVECEVIVKETATDLIVRTEYGEKVNILTSLPDVRKGHKGKLLTIGGRTVFIREPYGGD